MAAAQKAPRHDLNIPDAVSVPLNAKDLPARMGWGVLCFKTEKFRCFWEKTWYTKGN